LPQKDGDGEITEYEFLLFMLVAADLADRGVIEALHTAFTKLDADGGGTLVTAHAHTLKLGEVSACYAFGLLVVAVL
jgi:hypothetical protein